MNAVAQLITMFFLITYATLNLVVMVEQLQRNGRGGDVLGAILELQLGGTEPAGASSAICTRLGRLSCNLLMTLSAGGGLRTRIRSNGVSSSADHDRCILQLPG